MRCQTPGRPAVSRETRPLPPLKNPCSPGWAWSVGSIPSSRPRGNRTGKPVRRWSEEKALEGHNPRRARSGRLRLRAAASRAPSPPELTSGVATTRLRADWKNDRRGEASREVPLAGRCKTLKGEPHGRCGGRRAVARRGGEEAAGRVIQTLRAEGAGGWNPRVNRILLAGMCRRGAKPHESRLSAFGPGGGARVLILQRAGQAHVRRNRTRKRAG